MYKFVKLDKISSHADSMASFLIQEAKVLENIRHSAIKHEPNENFFPLTIVKDKIDKASKKLNLTFSLSEIQKLFWSSRSTTKLKIIPYIVS